jgi:type VI secretion system protein ImpB
MPESTQKKLSRIRPPRVQITYDVEIGDAIQMKELPFVVGILADLSGKPAEALPRLKDRKFVEIDRDNFDEVLAKAKPRLALRVTSKLNGDGKEQLPVELGFKSIEDFDPVNVVKQVESLRKLFEARGHLIDLLAKLDGNETLEKKLQEIVDNPESQKLIEASVAKAKPSPATA